MFKKIERRRKVKRLVKTYLTASGEEAPSKRREAFIELLQMAGNPNRKTLIRRLLEKKKDEIDRMLNEFNPELPPDSLLRFDRVGRTKKRLSVLGMAASFLSGFVVPGSLLKMAAGGVTVQLFNIYVRLDERYETLILPRYIRKMIKKNVKNTFEEVIGYLNTPAGLFDYLDEEKLKSGLEKEGLGQKDVYEETATETTDEVRGNGKNGL